jgi:hypothetical protein
VRWFIERARVTVRVRDVHFAAEDRESPWWLLEEEMRVLYGELERAGLRGAATLYEEADIERAWHGSTVPGALPTWRLL